MHQLPERGEKIGGERGGRMLKSSLWKVGNKVRFAHQNRGDASYTVKTVVFVAEQPMVELKELPGQFAVHIFVAADYPDDSIVPRPRCG
jgi:hypothetical protein